MELSNFKILFSHTEDRLILSFDMGPEHTIRCWLTRVFTRDWLSVMLKLQHQVVLNKLVPNGRTQRSQEACATPLSGQRTVEPGGTLGDDDAANVSYSQVNAQELNGVPVAVGHSFQAQGDAVFCQIAFASGDGISLTLSQASWREIARVIRQADRIAQWDLHSLMWAEALDDAVAEPTESLGRLPAVSRSRHLH